MKKPNPIQENVQTRQVLIEKHGTPSQKLMEEVAMNLASVMIAQLTYTVMLDQLDNLEARLNTFLKEIENSQHHK